jgi:hypothetical protein
VSFDSDSSNENNPSHSNGQASSRVNGTLKFLGNLTQKANEPLLNAILRQAKRNGLLDSLGFPNRTTWIKDSMPGWFSPGGILDG